MLNAKGKGYGKSKGKGFRYIPKPKNPKPFAKEHPAKDDACYHYKEVGHYKRNCLAYLVELIKKKNCGTHICNTKQGLRGERKLKQGAFYLYVGNGVHAQVEAIGSYDLVLSNGLVIFLDNCHYAPTITRGVVSVSCLVDNGFIQCFTDYGILVSKNYVLYFNSILSDGIYGIDMLNLVLNVNSIYNDSYFITFMDDYSRYGYVYLLKHKHEVFETFKVFRNEVEDQLGKTIMALRSDREGEYISQELKDYLKSCGIFQQFTPPYAPQLQWGVSEGGILNIYDLKQMRTIQKVHCGFIDVVNDSKTQGVIKGYPKETMGYYFYLTPENKIVVASEIPMEVKGFKLPREEVVPVHPKSDKWVDAMNAEMQSMKDNQVWCLVDLPPNCKTIGSKWLFKKKTDMDGIMHTYKACLVAKGYTQTYNVDYEGTFSLVADIRAIRILIAIAASYDYEICQMDFKTAFLNGYLNEDIYMVQPEGFVKPNHPRKVCKLQRSIYGLKQASRSWNKRFDEEIKRFGFTQNLDEPCVYQKASGSNVTFLILYVDDIIIMGKHIPSLQM
ncbi:retrotransposon protein, putative, ty1-copia subclass [Tanacetum coccineum]